ncbi:DNA topoisomerase 3 [Hydromonas duriensis]|uniref:DNA topoisomerase n=1 Tax=Hydromonas duriensis TaxID=1527608 RepID=A0A4R6Y0T2_9BURK|nr:DNA topoisomerase 3 [Hydromonas duriensis]TDR28952.1 DNA topoisomerase-3 [Hydromonas duriensis]
MRLFLCEKPSQAKELAAVVLGKSAKRGNGCLEAGDDCITWAYGHLLKLAMPDLYDERLRSFSNIEALPIIPKRYLKVESDGAKDQLNNIKGLFRRASEVVIATDADREGELIGRELVEYFNYKGKVSRVWLQGLDKVSIEAALKSIAPASKTEGLYSAGKAREQADWLYGMNLSRIYTQLYGDKRAKGKDGTISVGRVQTPTLALVVARDNAIDTFVSKTHYHLKGVFQHANGSIDTQYVLPKSCLDADGHCVDKKLLQAVATKVEQATGHIDGLIVETKSEPAPLPYDLSTLQKEASKRLKVSVKKVLDIAQALYETHKILSYPRTDCRYLPTSQMALVENTVSAMASMDPSLNDVLPFLNLKHQGRAWNDAQVAKSSHHGIIPTSFAIDLSLLKHDERVVYEMVKQRYLMQFASDYEFERTELSIDCEGESFRAFGNVERFKGWKGLFAMDDDNDADNPKVKLPIVAEGDKVTCVSTDVGSIVTKPPLRYTEDTLLTAMESVANLVVDPQMKKVLRDSKGIGTPATRAATIEKLIDIQMIEKTRNKIVSTEKGRHLIAKLPEAITSPVMTAVWENTLDQMARGLVSESQFMELQHQFVTQLVEAGKQQIKERSNAS